jgi:antitoxin HicB
MMLLCYPVNLVEDDNGAILVTCPDLPEAATFGENREDALLHAVDAIETAVQGRIADREPVRLPTAALEPVV